MDDGLSSDQKHRLRKILQEALQYIDEENILDFLKSSLYFRLMFCLHYPLKAPIPKPGPSPSGHANTPTPSEGPDGSSWPPTSGPDTNGPDLVSPSSSPTEALNETETTPKATENPPKTSENPPNEEKGNTENDMPDLPEVGLQNAIPSISGWNEIPDLDVDDLVPDDLTEMNRVSSPFDPAAQSAELEELKKWRGSEKASLVESRSDNSDMAAKLSEFLPNGKESTMIEESVAGNDGAVGTSSDGVGKAALRAEESPKANSDDGEFQSVITIDYDDLADEEEKTEVDPSPIEPNEQLS